MYKQGVKYIRVYRRRVSVQLIALWCILCSLQGRGVKDKSGERGFCMPDIIPDRCADTRNVASGNIYKGNILKL